MSAPSTNGSNGERDAGGRFRKGNAGGPGNPLAGRIATLRAALISAIGEQDIEAIASAMIASAKAGDVAAVRVLLSYTIGQPQPADLIERLERLEQSLAVETTR